MRTHTRERIVLGMLLALLLASAAGAQGRVALTLDELDDAAFPSMEAVVSVVDPNGVPVAGLTQASFEVSEDGKPVKVSQVSPSVNLQLKIAVALAIDASGSMRGEAFQDARDAATDFLNMLGPQDEVAIVIFADEVDLGEPFPQINPEMEARFTADKGALKNLLILADAVEGARTPLYDAAFKAIKMTVGQPVGRRAVILFTDGNEKREDERASILQPDDPIAEATKFGIPVFTIGLGPQADEEYLQRIALLTGGTYDFAETSEELADLFQEIAERLKRQYTLSWESNTAVDYADHEGQVRVKTSVGDAQVAFSFNATPAGVWIRQLHLKEGTEKRPLEDDQEVQGGVLIEPEVYARTGISQVEYYVDDALLWTASASPFLFSWDTSQTGAGSRVLKVMARDNSTPPLVGEKTLRLTVGTVVGGLGVPPWVLALGLAVVLGVAGWLVLSRRRPQPECPTCGRVMDPSWAECHFCAAEMVTQAGAEVPPGEPFEPITSVERLEAAPLEAGPGVERPFVAPETVSLRREPQPLAWLVVEKGDRAGTQFRLHAGDTGIGRAGDNDIIIDDPTVSRQQAKVRLEGKAFYLHDLGATNTTLVNGNPVSRCKLEEGDRVQMGNVVLIFKRA